MNALADALSRVGRDLDQLGHPWALVGALAVAVHAEARATLDVDVAVTVDGPGDAAALVSALRSRGYSWIADFGTAMTSLGVPTVEGTPALRVDLLFALIGIEPQIARAAERLTVVAGLELPVAKRGDLIAIKLLSAGAPGREHDWRDLRLLLERATAADLERARATIRSLEAAGASPAETLGRRLDELLARR